MSAVLENVEIAQELSEGYFVFGTGADVNLTSVFDANDQTSDAEAGNDLVSPGLGEDTSVAEDGDTVLSGGLGADMLAFEFFGDEQMNAIADLVPGEGEDLQIIDEEGDELTISELFFTENGIGDGELLTEFESDQNVASDAHEADDDDFEIL